MAGKLDGQKVNYAQAAANYQAAIAEGQRRAKKGYTDCQNKVAVWINNGWDRGSDVMHCYACRADGSHWQPLVFANGSTTFVGGGAGDNFTFQAPNWGGKSKGPHEVTTLGRSVNYTARSRCATITVLNARLSGRSILFLKLNQ
jgi:hypothetical protein